MVAVLLLPPEVKEVAVLLPEVKGVSAEVKGVSDDVRGGSYLLPHDFLPQDGVTKKCAKAKMLRLHLHCNRNNLKNEDIF